VSRWTGRDTDGEQVAEIDGRDETKAARGKEKVKVASGNDAEKKRKKDSERGDDPIAARPKSKKPATTDERSMAQSSKKKPSSPKDPFQDDAADIAKQRADIAKQRADLSGDAIASNRPAARRPTANAPEEAVDEEPTVALASRGERSSDADELAAADIRKASHRERREASDPEWTRDEPSLAGSESSPSQRPIPEASGEGGAPTETVSVAKKLSTLNPSRASYLQLCPNAEGDVRELVAGLNDSDLEHVRRCIHRLGRLGPEASASLPALERLREHSDGNVRIHAALAICRIDGVSPAVLDTLIQELKADDPGRRSFAAAVIAELGPLGGDATPALADALSDRDPYVRLHVAEVLIRCDDWSERALRTLLDCLNDKDENIRWLATYSLAELAPQSDAAVQALAEALADNSSKVRIGAIYALGEIGPRARPVARNLRRLDHDPNPEIRSAVAYALEQINSSANSPEK
jgi:HEAT repeat protein